MFMRNNRKDSKNFITGRTVINGDTAIKPYYYMRNGLLHVRYTVDRAVELTPSEEEEIKTDFARDPSYKQDILSKKWNLLTTMVERTVISDGIKAGEERMKELSESYGHKD